MQETSRAHLRRKFLPFVNWLTFLRKNPGEAAVHRKAEADFNFRGWQGRRRHTASTALFLFHPPLQF
jgi:hypothetical protein